MDITYEVELKNSNDLIVGDNIKIGGLLCEVEKTELVFHHLPNNRIRLTLTCLGATKKKSEFILFLSYGIPIETLK